MSPVKSYYNLYEGCAGRTIPEEHRTVTPEEGKVILRVCKRNEPSRFQSTQDFLSHGNL
jgi:hypothetical protein